MIKVPFSVRWRALLVGLALSVAGGSPGPSAAAKSPADPTALPAEAAAVVDGMVIPRSLVDNFVNNYRAEFGWQPDTEAGRAGIAKARGAVLEELIERALVAAELQRRGLAVADADLDAAEQRAILQRNGEAGYLEFVRHNGFSRPEYRERILLPTVERARLAAALGKEVVVTDEDVKTYYEAHRTEAIFQLPERVAAAHILVNTQAGALASHLERTRGLAPNSPESKAAIAEETERRRRLAEDVRTQAVAPGADFAALAKQHSDDFGTRERGGSLGAFARGTHPAALDEMLFGLKEPGEIGPVVQTEFGFHIARLEARLPAGARPMAEADALIRPALHRARQAERMRDWLQTARAKAQVVVAPTGG